MKKLRINREGKIKSILSLILLFYAIIVGIISNNIIIVLAMLFSNIGDMLLLANRGCLKEKKQETFEQGMIAFSLSHLLYMRAMRISLFSNILIIISSLFITILILLINNNYKSKTVIFSLYGSVLILNLLNSFNFSIIAGLGMLLFIISDIIVVITKIRKKRTMTSQFIIWITYIFAQICLLTSFLL